MNRLLTLTKPNLIPYNQLARNFRSSSQLLVDSSNERQKIELQFQKKKVEKSELVVNSFITPYALLAGGPFFGNFLVHTDMPGSMIFVSIASYFLVPYYFSEKYFDNKISKNIKETQHLLSQLEKLEPNEQVEVNEVNEVIKPQNVNLEAK